MRNRSGAQGNQLLGAIKNFWVELLGLDLPLPIHIPELRAQKFHLVRQDTAIAQEQVLRQVGNVRNSEQGHVGLFRGSPAFMGITAAAGRHHIGPMITPASGDGFDVIPGEVFIVVFTPAIQTHVTVAAEQFTVGQGRHVPFVSKFVFAAHRYDGVDFDNTLLAGETGCATMQGKGVVSSRPCNHIAGIDTYRFLPENPFDRLAGHIKT
jgi:hypothetical protein